MSLIIGHRGASRDAPENTLASFRLAFEQGADGIEADFRLAADGTIVCLHDASTGRTAGIDLEVAHAGCEELGLLDVGLWKGERWRDERMPTLAQVLRFLPPGKLLFIELKSGPEIIPALAQTLEQNPVAPQQLRFLSFSAELIAQVKEAFPGHRACWLTDYRWRGTWHPSVAEVLATLRRCRADGLASRSREVVDQALVGALRRESLELHLWTVDREGEARRLRELGVDSIMTNRPGWLRGRLEAVSSPAGGSP